MTHLIALSGYARSGKDTVAAYLVEEAAYQRVGFADSLREVALALDPMIPMTGFTTVPRHLVSVIAEFGWEDAKDLFPEVRRILQRLGTEVGRGFFGDDVWVNLALGKVNGRTVFPDCRFPNEAEAIRSRGGEVWRIVRPGFEPVNGHPSETALDDFEFDFTIVNDTSIDDLYRLVWERIA